MSVSLCIISPDKATAKPLVDKYGKYFNKVIVELAPDTQDFSAARNKALKKVKTKYWFWADTDDDIENIEKLPDLVEMMETERLDQIFLPYEYLFSDSSRQECVALHYRERLIRTSHPFKWVGKVHETLDTPENPKRMKVLESVSIKHAYKPPQDIKRSHERNVAIFKKSYKAGDRDPRTLYYLGIGLFGEATYEGNPELYKDAAAMLLEYTQVSGWEEQRYDAWMKIADCLVLIDEFDRAINALLEGMKLLPDWPDAYLKMGDLYLHMEQPGRAIEWLKVGLGKPKPETLEIQDPTAYTYRPLISLALAYFGLARVDEARKYIEQAAKFEPRNRMFKSAYQAIVTAHTEEQTIKAAAWLGKFVEEQGDVKKYVDGLPPFIRNDLRLRPLWVRAHPASKWPQKSIVFYCGEQWEDWGPDTLDKGMGGSEEAIVYLSRELAKLGWRVTVYNQRTEEYVDGEGTTGAVRYKPWELFNPEDEFDVFVAWRNPAMAQKLKIKARLSCVDFHDTPTGHQAVTPTALKAIDLCFLKSKFQKELGEIPDDKAVVIPNGDYTADMNFKVKRNPKKVIYASSADRGLDILLDLWPEVKKEVPDAELVWAYGWNSYDALHKGSPEHGRWKWEVIRKMNEVGARELGRLSHEDLVKEFLSSGVWAYPTSFPEISCITAMRAQITGCKIVTSGYAALQETIIEPEEAIEDIHEKPKEIKKFTQRLVKALKEPRDEAKLAETAGLAKERYLYENIARKWSEVLSGKG